MVGQVEQAQEAEKRGPARGEDVRDDDLDDEVPRKAFKVVLYPAYFLHFFACCR